MFKNFSTKKLFIFIFSHIKYMRKNQLFFSHNTFFLTFDHDHDRDRIMIPNSTRINFRETVIIFISTESKGERRGTRK